MGLKLYQNAYDIINQYLFGGINRNSSSVNYSNLGGQVVAQCTDGTFSSLCSNYNSSGTNPPILTLLGKTNFYASTVTENQFNFTTYNNDSNQLFSLSYNTSSQVSRSIYSQTTTKEYLITLSLANSGNDEITINSIDFEYQTITGGGLVKYILWATYFLDEPITLAAGESQTCTIKITTALPTTDPDLVS